MRAPQLCLSCTTPFFLYYEWRRRTSPIPLEVIWLYWAQGWMMYCLRGQRTQEISVGLISRLLCVWGWHCRKEVDACCLLNHPV